MNPGALSIALKLLEEEHDATSHYGRSVFVGVPLYYHLRTYCVRLSFILLLSLLRIINTAVIRFGCDHSRSQELPAQIVTSA